MHVTPWAMHWSLQRERTIVAFVPLLWMTTVPVSRGRLGRSGVVLIFFAMKSRTPFFFEFA